MLDSGKDKKGKDLDEEFEKLIKQLNSMSLKDPEYAMVYFKAYQINPLIKELVPTPMEQCRTTALLAQGQECFNNQE